MRGMRAAPWMLLVGVTAVGPARAQPLIVAPEASEASTTAPEPAAAAKPLTPLEAEGCKRVIAEVEAQTAPPRRQRKEGVGDEIAAGAAGAAGASLGAATGPVGAAVAGTVASKVGRGVYGAAKAVVGVGKGPKPQAGDLPDPAAKEPLIAECKARAQVAQSGAP